MAEVFLRIARARGSAKYYSTDVLIHKRFSENSQYFKISHVCCMFYLSPIPIDFDWDGGGGRGFMPLELR